MIEPISPKEAVETKEFPNEVMLAFNELITENLRNKTARITQDEVMDRILTRAPRDQNRNYYFDRGLLDVEPMYRKAGWKVEFDKPGYCEDYKATFTFSK